MKEFFQKLHELRRSWLPERNRSYSLAGFSAGKKLDAHSSGSTGIEQVLRSIRNPEILFLTSTLKTNYYEKN